MRFHLHGPPHQIEYRACSRPRFSETIGLDGICAPIQGPALRELYLVAQGCSRRGAEEVWDFPSRSGLCPIKELIHVHLSLWDASAVCAASYQKPRLY